jgi:hypothetical protein
MDIISIKDHPPWYARGTPVTNTRDGPARAVNDKSLFAICRGPSARGKPGGKTRRWLTLKTTFFNTKNSVYSQWYAVLGSFVVDADGFVVDADRSGDAVRSGGIFDLSACAAPDNAKLMKDNVKMEMENNVKLMKYNVKMEMEVDDNVKKRNGRMNCITTNYK